MDDSRKDAPPMELEPAETPKTEAGVQPSIPGDVSQGEISQGVVGSGGSMMNSPPPSDSDAEGYETEDDTAPGESLEDWMNAQQEAVHEEAVQEGIVQEIAGEPPFSTHVPWILLGILAGCIIGAAAGGFLVNRLKRGGITKTAKSLKVVTLQGLGTRESQQDSLAATEPELYAKQGTLLCVADGMGGLQNGSAVSRTAVQAVISTFNTIEKSDPERMVAAMVQNATIAVNRLLSPNFASGGTTLLIGYAREGKFYCASVGDSRICLVRQGKLIHLNRPHVLEDELILRYVNGEVSYDDARNYQKKGGLTSYLGMGSLKYVDFPLYHASILKGDRFVLMSDGVFNTLLDEELVRIFSKKPKNISSALNQEIQKKQKRFQDNYSAAVIVAE